MDLIHGAARETRTYSFPEGGSFALVVEPDSPGTIFILGLGRDQDEPADALLADRVERLAGEVGGVVRTHGVTWSVEPSSVGATHPAFATGASNACSDGRTRPLG